jgi:hypothetical protein
MRKTAVLAAVMCASLVFGAGAKRRAVRSAPCSRPTVNLTVTPQTACPTDTVTLSWRASESKAIVSIDGVGDQLPWTGSTRILDGRRAFSGFASNTCGPGDKRTIAVNAPEPPAGSVSGPSSMLQGDTASLFVDVSGSTHWSLTSSLSNSFIPSAGLGSEEVTYRATNYGTDGILLHFTGQCGATDVRAASLVVERRSTTTPPPPPPPPAGLRCCDGTRSPSCFNCVDKRGCCSSHGGVCGC